MKTVEEILLQWTDKHCRGFSLNMPGAPMLTHLFDLIEMAQADAYESGKAEQKENEKLTPEMLESLFPNSIKRSTAFGYGIIHSQNDFIEELRKYILDAKERGNVEQKNRDADIAESINWVKQDSAEMPGVVAKAIREQE